MTAQAVRRGEIVEHEFVSPVPEKPVYPYRCSLFDNVPYVVLRSRDPMLINSDGAKRIADDAKKLVGKYSNSGIEAVGAAFPVDPETGELADTHVGVKEGQTLLYERRYRINAGISF